MATRTLPKKCVYTGDPVPLCSHRELHEENERLRSYLAVHRCSPGNRCEHPNPMHVAVWGECWSKEAR